MLDFIATWLMVLLETIITVILIDDIYGFKEIKNAVKKYGRMKKRRWHRQFLKTSKKYFRKPVKSVPESNEEPKQ